MKWIMQVIYVAILDIIRDGFYDENSNTITFRYKNQVFKLSISEVA